MCYNGFIKNTGVKILNYQYNVKAIITNISDRTIISGYRPAHNINGYLTTGIHKYIDQDAIGIAESSIGFIAFITPELYIDNINCNDIEFGLGINTTGDRGFLYTTIPTDLIEGSILEIDLINFWK